MQIWIIRIVFALFGGALGFIIGDLTGGAIGFFVTIILVGIETSIPRPLLRDFFACFAGLTFGLIVASLIIYIIRATTGAINSILTASIVLSCAYVGTMIVYRRRDAFALFSLTTHGIQSKSPTIKVLDTRCDYRWTDFGYLPNRIY